VGYIKRRNGHWQAAIRGSDGRERTKTFGRKVDAQAWIDTNEGDRRRGHWIDPALGRITLREYAEAWRAKQVHAESTMAQVETHLRRHVYPALGDIPIAALRPSDLQAWVKGRAAVLAPATVEVVHAYLSAILNAAVADGVIARNHASLLALPRKANKQILPPSTDQVLALIATVPERYRGLVVFTAGTGLRQGEVFGVTVPRLDLLRRNVEVCQQVTLLAGSPPKLTPMLKTDASYRTVPLPQVVVDAVALHLATFGPGDEQVSFSSEDGTPIRRTRFSERVWQPAARAAGLAPRTGMHALRHYYASLLIDAGESVKVVQSRLGHKTAKETLDTYGHLWPDSEDRTRLAVDAVLGPAGQSPGSAEIR